MRKKMKSFIINLEKRPDRRGYALQQFEGKPEFEVTIVKAIENTNGTFGLWQTIVQIIKGHTKEPFILICEDDHEFTEDYSYELLTSCIHSARERKADILLGGVSWFKDGLQINQNLFWLDQFTGLQFMIVFKKFYNIVLSSDFLKKNVADFKISGLTENKFMIYPFISTQKEFGYSDVTITNNKAGYVTEIFARTSGTLDNLNKAKKFYSHLK